MPNESKEVSDSSELTKWKKCAEAERLDKINAIKQLEQELQQAQEDSAEWKKLAKELDAEIESDGYRAQDKQIKNLQSQLSQANEATEHWKDLTFNAAKFNDELQEQLSQAREELAAEKEMVKVLHGDMADTSNRNVSLQQQLHQSNSLVLELRKALTEVKAINSARMKVFFDTEHDEIDVKNASNMLISRGLHSTAEYWSYFDDVVNKALSLTLPTSANYIPREEYEKLLQLIRKAAMVKLGYKGDLGEGVIELKGSDWQEALDHATQLLKGGQ